MGVQKLFKSIYYFLCIKSMFVIVNEQITMNKKYKAFYKNCYFYDSIKKNPRQPLALRS